MKEIKAGEIWIVKLSIKAEDTIGHETQKTRPCIVVANSQIAKMITVIPLQSNLRALNLPNTYLIRCNRKNALKKDSVAAIFQLRSLDYKRFRNKNGVLDNNDLNKIKFILKGFLNL